MTAVQPLTFAIKHIDAAFYIYRHVRRSEEKAGPDDVSRAFIDCKYHAAELPAAAERCFSQFLEDARQLAMRADLTVITPHKKGGRNHLTARIEDRLRQQISGLRRDFLTYRFETPRVHTRPAASRNRPARNTFKLSGDCPAASVLIVDDFIASGHTVSAIAGLLRASGAKSVKALCLGWIPSKDTD